jgi:hypothetical protein
MSTQFSQSVNVTNLDFVDIKQSLIDYFKLNDSPFKDWDYTGSGLNTLMDVLAHNTHYNAVLAHMAVNESFIDSAQLRQNVVSAAKLIGYTPNSYTAPKAKVNLYVNSRDSSINSYVIPAYTKFSSNFPIPRQSATYNFINLTDIVCTRNQTSGLLEAFDQDIHQGSMQTRRIQINSAEDKNEYVISDKNIDLRTLQVVVYQNSRQDIGEVYTKFTDVTDVNGDTPIYFIYENYSGNYVVSFGNGVFGKKPDNLNILELRYLVTSGDAANTSNKFTYNAGFDTLITAVSVQTSSPAYGGSTNESIGSIKYNAPLQYIAQNRAVTADDYKTLIQSRFGVRSMAVWGGEENNPPQYGKVFMSIKKSDDENDIFLNSAEKEEILQYLSGKKVLSILPEIVDPEYINIVLDVLFKYNRNLTAFTVTELQDKIKETIVAFSDNNLESFDGVFRHSQLVRAVDGTSPAILNSLVRVFVSKTFTAVASDPKNLTIEYGTALTIDDGLAIVKSTGWVSGGVIYYMGDAPHAKDSNLRRLYSYYIDSNNTAVVGESNIGTLTLSTGTLSLNAFGVDSDTAITIDLLPKSNDIVSRRNQLIRIDTPSINVYGEVDTIAIGGSSKSIDYNTFSRDR